MSTPTTRPNTKSLYRVTPEMFLAVGDGVTNDRPALNNAVTWLSNVGGGLLELTPGKTYLLGSALSIPASVILVGNGGVIDLDDYNLTLNGPIIAPSMAVFNLSGTGVVVFTGGTVLTQDGALSNQEADAELVLERLEALSDDDVICTITARGKDASGNAQDYGDMRLVAKHTADGNEDGEWQFRAARDGSIEKRFVVNDLRTEQYRNGAGASMNFYRTDTHGDDVNTLQIYAYGKDSGGVETEYGRLLGRCEVDDDGSEGGSWEFKVADGGNSGTSTTIEKIHENGIDITSAGEPTELNINRTDTHGDDENIAVITATGKDSGGANNDYAQIVLYCDVDNAGSEDGEIQLWPCEDGSLVKVFQATRLGIEVFRDGAIPELYTHREDTLSGAGNIWAHRMYGVNNAAEETEFGRFAVRANAVADGSEGGECRVSVADAGNSGALTQILTIDEEGTKADVAGFANKTQTVTSTSSAVAVDCKAGLSVRHTMTEDTTIGAPTNPVDGFQLVFTITQDTTTRTLSFNSVFRKAGGSFTLSTGSGDVDTIVFEYDGTYWNEISRSQALA